MTNEVMTIQEVEKKEAELAALEEAAAEHFRSSRKSFDDAVLALDEIRDRALWVYARDVDGHLLRDRHEQHWEDYVSLFCLKKGVSRSWVFGHLATVATWKALGLPREQLQEVGVQAAGYIKPLVHVDGRTGELILPPQEVIETLPPGNTPVDRVVAKIQEVFQTPLTPADIRKSFTVDVGSEPEISIWQSGKNNGGEGGDIWFTWSWLGDNSDGVLIPASNYFELPTGFREWLVGKLRIQEFKKEGK